MIVKLRIVLPRSAAWGSKTSTAASSSAASRQTRRGATSGITRDRERQPRNITERTTGSKSNHDRKLSTTKTPSQASNSRPSTPSITGLPPRPASPADVKTSRKKKEQQKAQRPQSPEPEPITETEDEAALQQAAESKPAESVVPSAPPGLPAPPPGLSAPPGLPGPRPPRVDSASPQTPLLAYHSTYQVSNAALALIDDVKARRGQQPTAAAQSPFPDLDRTLQSLTSDDGGVGFSWDIDPRLIVDEVAMSGDESGPHVVDLERETLPSVPYTGFHAGFPALVNGPYPGPPGLIPHHSSSRVLYDANDPFRSSPIEPQSTEGSAKYTFDPFDEPSSSRRSSVIDDDSTRKMSRFGFARGRQGSTTSSPMHIPSPLSISSSNLESTHSLYNNSFTNSTNSPIHPHWSTHDYQTSPMANSPLTQVQQPIPQYIQQTRYQSFEAGVSEAQLRELIQSSRGRNSPNVAPHVIGKRFMDDVDPIGIDIFLDSQESYQSGMNQQFTDPAIMSARIATRPESNVPSHYGPPPGLSFPATGPMNHPHQPYAMSNVLTAGESCSYSPERRDFAKPNACTLLGQAFVLS
jgi:CCR4-NOT transcription complex subunit 4